jgi:hypothetical protein
MPIENRNLEPGARLISTYKKETYHALVVASVEGKVLYHRVPYDGKEYKSPSSLGTAVTGKACNGWTFWSVDSSAPEASEEASATQQPPAEEETSTEEQEPQEGTQPQEPTGQEAPEAEDQDSPDPPEAEVGTREPVTAGFRRVPNQRGVPEGEVRLYCDTCQSSFTAPVGQQSDTCPQGHWPDDAGSGQEESQS